MDINALAIVAIVGLIVAFLAFLYITKYQSVSMEEIAKAKEML
jgi:hypothetical protein